MFENKFDLDKGKTRKNILFIKFLCRNGYYYLFLLDF